MLCHKGHCGDNMCKGRRGLWHSVVSYDEVTTHRALPECAASDGVSFAKPHLATHTQRKLKARDKNKQQRILVAAQQLMITHLTITISSSPGSFMYIGNEWVEI